MNSARSDSIIVDTDIFSAEFKSQRGHGAQTRARAPLRRRRLLVSFVTAAEMRFGARLASWGPQRRIRMETRLADTPTIWADPELTHTYAALRTWCVRNGHGLGQKVHEADRWIAATAMHLDVPLVTHDGIFRDVDGLRVWRH